MKLSSTLHGLALAGALLTLSAPEVMAQRAEEFRISGRESAVYNIAGRVRIVRGQGSDVVVRVTRSGSDADELEIEVGSVDGRETLRVLYPADRIIIYPEMGRGSNTTVRVGRDGTFYDGRRRGGDRIEVRGSGRGLEAYADLEIQVPAGVDFSLYLAVGETDVRGVEGDFLIDTGAGSVTAESVTGSLDIDTGSGRVSVRDVEGDVRVDTGSGQVVVEDIRGHEINVDTGSGSVEGANLTADLVRVDTGSGSIDLEDVSAAEVFLDTGSGGVRVELLQDVESLEIDTGSGSVTVWLPEGVGANLEIETGSGGIDLDFPVQIRRVGRDHVVGLIGDGRGRIHIDTGSGSVRLARR